MNELSLQLSSQAERDLEEAALWYEGRRAGLGNLFLDNIDELFIRITEAPGQFPKLNSTVRRALIRRFPYAVYFVVERKTVTVLAVLHQHRSPKAWLNRI